MFPPLFTSRTAMSPTSNFTKRICVRQGIGSVSPTTATMTTPSKTAQMVTYRVFSNDLKEYFDVDDGLADKDTEDQAQYCLETEEDWGENKCYFNLRWRFIEDRCDASDTITKGKKFQRLCCEWTTIRGISSSSSFAANMDYWLEEEE